MGKRLFGLIGHPLEHSFSKDYFTAKFTREGLDCEYQNFDLENLSLATLRVTNGFNVTSPYKESILPLLDEIDPLAEAVEAVNTVKVLPDGRLKGYNTDVFGVAALLAEVGLTPSSLAASRQGSACAASRHCEGGTTEATRRLTDRREVIQPDPNNAHPLRALILGTGGASLSVQFVLRQLNLRYTLVSRSIIRGDYLYEELTPEILQSHLLIVNATPVGMYPHVNEAPLLPYEGITPKHILLDLIYNPEETLFLKYGREQGATTANGLPMLHAQAEASWSIWNQKE